MNTTGRGDPVHARAAGPELPAVRPGLRGGLRGDEGISLSLSLSLYTYIYI